MADGDGDTDTVASSTPLSSIKKHLSVGRVARVVAVIKSCTPNGFGDMTVTLKVRCYLLPITALLHILF